MGRDGYSFAVLLQFLEDSIKDFPDVRIGKNTVYEVRDAVLSAFSVFFMQCPSFLAHQKAMGMRKGKNNAQSIFGVHKIPTDNQIRSLLDPVSPELLFPVFDRIFEFLVSEGIIRDMVTEDGFLLIALDGTWFYSSEQIACDACQSKQHRNGQVTYYHSAITPVIVKPEVNRVVSLPPEFITVDDGSTKQDCENKAVKRWIKTIVDRYRYRNDVPLKDGDKAMQVNWMELSILDKEGTIKKRFSFVTDLPITDANITRMISYGRSRWKIENENNNILKTKGYHLEHNFGHGKKHLSNFLMTLNLLAYLFHTVAEMFDRRYLLLRKTLPSRKTFFQDAQALTKYFFYESWDNLLKAMVIGLELEDPGG
ncbi:MAG: ISNCY family transposase [Synergistota bacterium]|nr:ISNCY family transposase [Synergistota bacterium]